MAGHAAPSGAAADRLQTDTFRVDKAGAVDNPANYDIGGELGGYVPKFREHLFFFGAYNPIIGILLRHPAKRLLAQ